MLKLVTPTKNEIEIRASHLTVAYGNQVALDLRELSCRGNIIGLIGHNGAGKSTLMKAILGLLPLQHGNLKVSVLQGKSALTLNPKEHMAFCPETGSVFSDISVKHYIQMWCRVKHNDSQYYRKQGRDYLQLFEIEPLLRKLGRELSKGQRRRVQTLIGFLTDPQLFLIDEPFDGLDVEKTQELIDIIKAESAQRSFIISSHRMDVVERMADQVIALQHSKLAACGSIKEVCHALGDTSIAKSEKVSLVDAMSYHLKQAQRASLPAVN